MDKRRIGVRAIIFKDGKLLAVRHKSKDDGSAKDFWAIPGGGLDHGESLENGLKREVQEELGIDAVVGRLLFIQQFTSGRTDCEEELEFFFLVENANDFAAVDYIHTTHGAHELAACEFIDAKSERVLPRFIGEIELESYVQTVQPVLVANLFDEAE